MKGNFVDLAAEGRRERRLLIRAIDDRRDKKFARAFVLADGASHER